MRPIIEDLENPMVCFSEQRGPKVIGKCACGCGEEIIDGYEHIFWDGYYFDDYECLMRFIGAEWRDV
ncbi:hypothetical protein [Caenibacillus caldisaponilyticus]|uniref:hypothetical protein n=1 Tax=Caenibacillus caldisaponilyticus TaxID=1674942 RepID=UPI0009888796|nr:hypothetical protein [Caenibacillus caldisaponilyticus]